MNYGGSPNSSYAIYIIAYMAISPVYVTAQRNIGQVIKQLRVRCREVSYPPTDLASQNYAKSTY